MCSEWFCQGVAPLTTVTTGLGHRTAAVACGNTQNEGRKASQAAEPQQLAACSQEGQEGWPELAGAVHAQPQQHSHQQWMISLRGAEADMHDWLNMRSTASVVAE
jgi:hypothetical protein